MPKRGDPLSEREMEVLRLVATGATNEQIARELVISVNTVKVHVRNIFAKLDVSSRTEASLHAVREGWVTLEPADEAQEDVSADSSAEQAEQVLPQPAPVRWPRWTALVGIVALLLALAIGLTGVPYRWINLRNTTPSPAILAPDQRWTQLSDMASPRRDLALVPFQEFVYAIGGQSEEVSGATERYDPLNDTWTSLPPKPTAVTGVQAAVLGGLIYVPGGRDTQGNPTQVVEAYEVERNQWLPAADLPRALSAYALVAFEGRLYLFGGWDGTRYRDEILQYDPTADRWEQVGQIPTPWGHGGAVVASNRVFLFGGVNEEGPVHFIVEYSLPSPMGITSPLPGSVPPGRAWCTALGDYLYVLIEPDPPSAPQLWQHHVRTKQWGQINPSPFGLHPGSAISAIGTEDLLLVGGEDGETPLPLTQKYRAIYTVVPGLPDTSP